MTYNPWPLGELPKQFQRPEPGQIREMGYEWEDPRDIVDIFEKKVASFAGSKYAVAVDSCTNAIFLAAQFCGMIGEGGYVTIPCHTYVSVPQALHHAGYLVRFKVMKWEGAYNIEGTRIWDASLRWTEGMYVRNSLMCLSFQIKKRIPIGRGGMILCDYKEEYDWFKLASHDGRDLATPYDSPEHVKMMGWHFYMTPEDAARGIILMDGTPTVNPDQGGWENYPNLTKWLPFN